jgi:hypothetical protein
VPATDSRPVDELPFVDEHSIEVAASPDDLWATVTDLGRRLPGFRVVTAEPGSKLVLAGSHPFSNYALLFRIEGGRLVAESRAEFPGVHGRLYRAAVISTGAHVIAVRRLLSGIKQRAERRAQ